MKFDFRHRFLPEPINEEPTPNPFEGGNTIRDIGVFPIPYEPMMRNRWLLRYGSELDIQEWLVSETQRPTVVINNGSYEWEPITTKFRDPIGPSTTSKLWELFIGTVSSTDSLPIEPNRLLEIRNRFANIREHGLTFDLEMLDPTGVVISKWTIHNSEIMRIGFGDLSYDNDGLADCELVVKPGSVILHF